MLNYLFIKISVKIKPESHARTKNVKHVGIAKSDGERILQCGNDICLPLLNKFILALDYFSIRKHLPI
jgi:hypothetical protein